MRRTITSLLFLVCLLTLAPFTLSAQEDAPTTYWWNERVFYEIFVRSFYDSDGDGDGDLQGVIERLDYLNDGDPNTTTDLGVTGIWLMPVTESPSYHGYDVADYYAIDTDYGTMDDMRALLAAADERGIAVIVDLVMNHTSRTNPWFTSSAIEDEAYSDFYLWEDARPSWRGPDGQNVWHGIVGRFYYGLFWERMPDLNYTNPAVTDAMYEVNRFWLEDVGVDGFRLDAIKHLVEEGEEQENTAATHTWLAAYDEFIDSVNPEALTLGEAWTNVNLSSNYVEDGEVDMVFEFDLANAMLQSAARRDNGIFANVLQQVNEQYPINQYATFLTNHDQNRVMNQLFENMDAARTAASLLLTGSGVPFVYYGEEIGMTGVKPDERIRTPMQWDDTPNTAGFTQANQPWEALSEDNEEGISVAAQTDDETSLLSHYRDLIHLRNAHPALQHGITIPLESSDDSVYAALRLSPEETLLVLINLSDDPVIQNQLENSTPLPEWAVFTPEPGVLYPGGALDFLPDFNEDHTFEFYMPLYELAPYSVTVIGF